MNPYYQKFDPIPRRSFDNDYQTKFNPNNFTTAFNPLPNVTTNGYDPKIPFKNNNFVNSGKFMHNNLSEILLNEEIREYSVMIDSKDRNYQIYPDPFNYEVTFNPLPKTKDVVDGRTVYHEDPTPIINGNFSCVRYIKLEEILLPLHNKVKLVKTINEDDEIINKWQVDTNCNLTDDLYVIMTLGNKFSDESYKSTNDVLAESFATIYFDCKANNTHYFGCTSNGLKIFPQDQLGKIDKLKISFLDPYGYMIKCSHVNKNIRSNMECICDEYESDEETECFKHNIFHPLNPIFQHHIHLKIGIVEPRLNKLTFN